MSHLATATCELIHYYPDCTDRRIEEVLAIMQRWSARNDRQINHLRAFPRSELRGLVTIIRSYRNPLAARHVLENWIALHVPARNISQGGLGLIAPSLFLPESASDSTPTIKTDLVFREGIQVSIHINRVGIALLAAQGTVVRVRPTHRNFFEIGVKFLERSEIPNQGIADSDARITS